MSDAPLILIPPSEGKAPGGRSVVRNDRFAQLLGAPRDEVRLALGRALAGTSVEQQGRLFGVRAERLERARRSMMAIVADEAEVMPAWRRYTGVVWDHLDPSTLTPAARSRILVPSGLYGLNRATDEIADYRLTMHVSLPGIGNLGRFWTRPVSAALCGLRGHPLIVSLLPREHARAVLDESITNFIEVAFLAADGRRAAGHGAKAVKGVFSRYLLDHGTDGVLGFHFEGWRIRATTRGFTLQAPK